MRLGQAPLGEVPCGQRLILAVSSSLMHSYAAIKCDTAVNKSMDLVSSEEGVGEPTSDWEGLFAKAKSGM